MFEFDEIGGGECLKIKCCSAEKISDESIGSARVNLEGLLDGSCRDVWIPLEKVISGELRLQIQMSKKNGQEGNWVNYVTYWHIFVDIFKETNQHNFVAGDVVGCTLD
ncbi:hypothetical protein KSP40_PGU003102 [Platanthera guangdongensis]|uniref:Uncharacterized protein n=1 Tax=Platanthera guangdongensis TaxID=2320717 RepID=A0ABR2MN20_9ASPA